MESIKPYCSVDGCQTLAICKGWCPMHYQRNRKYGTLDRNPAWRAPNGSGNINSSGYKVIPHPKGTGKDADRVLEHRYVMSLHLGRDLLPSETVHHINGERLDNRLENLELWDSRHPKGQRIEDKIQFALEILKQYKRESLNVKYL